jgi:cell shape-determining protein MreD
MSIQKIISLYRLTPHRILHNEQNTSNMKILIRLLLLYFLFLIQTSIPKPQLDLVLLALVIFSLHDTSLYSLIMSLWSGFLIGLLNPFSFGFHIVIFTIIAFACNNIRRIIYKDKIYYLFILFLSLLFKYIMSTIIMHGQQWVISWCIATIIILILAIPLESLILNIFYRQWRMNVTENNY